MRLLNLKTFDVPLIRATTADGQLLESQGGQLAVQVAPALEARTFGNSQSSSETAGRVIGLMVGR